MRGRPRRDVARAHALRRERDHDVGRGARPLDLDHEPRRWEERDRPRERPRRRGPDEGGRPQRGAHGAPRRPTPSSSPASRRRRTPTSSRSTRTRRRPGRSSTGRASRRRSTRRAQRTLTASGFSETLVTTSAIANKKGNFGFHVGTTARYSTTMRTADGTGSGWAGFESPRLGDVKAAELAARAARKAETSAAPKELPPGAYTVILEPRAVADLFGNLFSSLTRRTVDEGRSFLSKPGGGNRIGEEVFAPSVTLRSDPFDPRLSGRPWSGGGGPGGGRRRVPRLRRVRRRGRRGPSDAEDDVGRKGSREGRPRATAGGRRSTLSRRCRSPAA